MQHLLKTPKSTRIHQSLDFALSEDSLRRSLAGLAAAEGMSIGFARFVGASSPGMPRPDVTYYPVLCVFRLAAGRRYRTDDDYKLEAGLTALVYPVYRRHKSLVRKALLEHVMPACRAWLEVCETGPEQTSGFYAVHDRTFDELVFGPNKIARANACGRLQFVEKSRVILSLRSGVAQL